MLPSIVFRKNVAKKICQGFFILVAVDSKLHAGLESIDPSPLHEVMNDDSKFSLVNSVDFHPSKNLFCITYTHNNCLKLYQLGEMGELTLLQVIQNPTAKLSCPQHAVFAKDGGSLVVANWSNQTFTIYHLDASGLYAETPSAVLSYPAILSNFRPHGIAFSPDGNYLAVAYGYCTTFPRGVALYRVNDLNTTGVSFTLLQLLQGPEIMEGIPKGIDFSPDGTTLVVTFSATNAFALYAIDWANAQIVPTPEQIVFGDTTELNRPEDIKFIVGKECCAVSNSGSDQVSFYPFDGKNYRFTQEAPSYTLKNPEAKLRFPHGLACSPDGKYLAVTQFGPVAFNDKGCFVFEEKSRKDSFAIFKLR